MPGSRQKLVEEKGVRFSAAWLLVRCSSTADILLCCFIQPDFGKVQLLVFTRVFTVIVTFKCMLVGYSFPVLSIYFGSINIALNERGKRGVINYEWGGLERKGGAVCKQITLNKSINNSMIEESKVNL